MYLRQVDMASVLPGPDRLTCKIADVSVEAQAGLL